MHKRLVNQCTIDFSLIPCGPILIKSGREGADPTKPDMEFVETYHGGGRSVYLPGSSLKGAIRAHAERIVRTVGRDNRNSDNLNSLWANDPLNDNYNYLKDKSASELYKLSSFTDQMFGNTSIASRVRIEDAYPVDSQPVKLEERNGVAIDRVFGSVAVGPFNYQVCTAGEFRTKLHLKNFSLAQLGLIGLVLRDLDEGWFGLGFAKSRGLGIVEVKLNEAIVQYPGCVIKNQQICRLGGSGEWQDNQLLGAGIFLEEAERERYGFPTNDMQDTDTPVRAESMALGFGVQLKWQGKKQVQNLFILAVRAWCQKVEAGAA